MPLSVFRGGMGLGTSREHRGSGRRDDKRDEFIAAERGQVLLLAVGVRRPVGSQSLIRARIMLQEMGGGRRQMSR